MHSVPEDEARSLLSTPMVLEGPCDFISNKQRPWHQFIEQGLLAPDGTRKGLIAKLEFSITPSVHIRTFQFGIFQLQLGGPRRVYQLTVTKFNRAIKDAHRLSHEHMGDHRSPAHPEWSHWTFEQAMAYFCSRTNLTIHPPVDDPETLRLK